MERKLLFIAGLLLSWPLLAAHLPGGSITWQCVGGGQYEVTLTLYRECSGNTVGPQTLNFASDCGSSFSLSVPAPSGAEVSQLCPADLANSTCNGGALPGIEEYLYTTTVPLSDCDGWTVSWSNCCRATSLNVIGTPGMYLESVMNTATGGCNGSPQFTNSTVPYVCVDQPVNYNYGAVDSENDSLHYSLVNAQEANPGPVSVTYVAPFSGAQPYTGITLDEQTGTVSFTPDAVGNVIVVVRVDEYNSDGELIGSVIRDIPFVVIPCANNIPDPATGAIINVIGTVELTGPYALGLCDGSELCFDAEISDADVTQSLTLTSNVESVLPGSSFGVSGTNPATATVCWNATPGSVGTYNFTITAEDDACPNSAVQAYAYTITVSEGPDAGTDGFVTRCSTDPPIDLFSHLGGTPDIGGTWSSGGPGIHIYTVEGTPPCPDASATVTVVEVQAPDAGIDNAINVCENGPAVLLIDSLGGTPEFGGTWTAPGGASHSGLFAPGVDGPGIYCYTVAGTAPCANATACLTITVLTATDPLCIPLGAADLVASRASLLPNPTMGELRLIGSQDGPWTAEVYDDMGRSQCRMAIMVTAGTAELRLPDDLASGQYVLVIRSSSGTDQRLPFALLR